MDSYRLLEETCQAALELLPCDLAWLFTVDEMALTSLAIATTKGSSAAEVFLWRYDGDSARHPTISREAESLFNTALSRPPAFNLSQNQLRPLALGSRLASAMNALRLNHLSLLPLVADGAPLGLFVLATANPIDLSQPYSERILRWLTVQATAVLENVRLSEGIAAQEEKRRTDQDFLNRVLETMGDSLVVIDDEAKIRYANNRLLLMSGYEREELYDQSVGMVFHPSNRDVLVNNLKRGGRGTINFSQQMLAKDGRVIPVLLSRSTMVIDGRENTIIVLSDLSEQKRREQALERQGERLRTLNRAVQAINAAMTQDDVVNLLLQFAREVVACESTTLFLQDGTDPEMFYVATEDGLREGNVGNSLVRLGGSTAGKAAFERRAQIALAAFTASEDTLPRRLAVLALPVVVANQLIGVLEVQSAPDPGFSTDDVEILENLAAVGAAGIEKARLYEEAQRRVRELGMLLEASSAISSTLDMSDVLNLVTRRLRETLDVARCLIAIWDKQHDQLSVLAEACDAYWPPTSGPERPIAKFFLAQGDPPAALALQVGNALLPPVAREQFTRFGMTGLLLVAIRFSPTVRGIVELYRAYHDNVFTDRQCEAVNTILADWDRYINRTGEVDWTDPNRLTQLAYSLMDASSTQWCVISHFMPSEGVSRALREIGFAIRESQVAYTYSLQDYPTMAHAMQNALSATLSFNALQDDENEQQLMLRFGAHTGLVTPLMVHGEAIGLVKLLDVQPTRTFDVGDISLSQGIANVIANALENAQLYQSIERRAAALEKAYNDLKSADNLKESLLQSLSHELKTPLHKVIMQLQLLDEDTFGELSAEQHDFIRLALGWTQNAASIVDQIVILQALRPQDMHFRAVNIADLVSRSVQKARTTAPAYHFNVNITPNLPLVRADVVHLISALDHLLENAVKFSPNGGLIEVHVWQDVNHNVVVCIQDYGIGIPPEEHQRIFERGVQLDSGITRRFGGVGLGLAVVQRIIESHSGKIWVESSQGQGSQFFFTLPTWHSDGS